VECARRDLIAGVQALLARGELKIAKGADSIRELLDMRTTGRETDGYGWVRRARRSGNCRRAGAAGATNADRERDFQVEG
jgi:hypothetical protein